MLPMSARRQCASQQRHGSAGSPAARDTDASRLRRPSSNERCARLGVLGLKPLKYLHLGGAIVGVPHPNQCGGVDVSSLAMGGIDLQRPP